MAIHTGSITLFLLLIQRLFGDCMPMETTARIYNCNRCHRQVILCSSCDCGNIYCLDGCSKQARQASIRRANRRYRRTPQGRRNAALRQARYRQRQRERAPPVLAVDEKVTHQGTEDHPPSDSIPSGSSEEDEKRSIKCSAAFSPPARPVLPTDPVVYRCHCCGHVVPDAFRRRFLHQIGRNTRDRA